VGYFRLVNMYLYQVKSNVNKKIDIMIKKNYYSFNNQSYKEELKMPKRDVITIYVSPEWKKTVTKKAKEQSQTLAAYVRAAIQEKMQNDNMKREVING